MVGKHDSVIEFFVDSFTAWPLDEPLWLSLRRVFDYVIDYADDEALARRMAVMDKVIQSSDSLRASYLERWSRAQERIAAIARERAAARGRMWAEDVRALRAIIGASGACLEAARDVAAKPGKPLGPLLDAAMSAISPLDEER